MSRYRTIELAMWSDEKFRELSAPQPNAQTIWQFLLTGPYTTSIPGVVVCKPKMIAFYYDWDESEAFREAFAKAFREVQAKGMMKVDRKAGLIWLPGAASIRRATKPASPNVVIGWAKYWGEVPECNLKSEALEALRSYTKALGKAYGEAFTKAFGKASPHPWPNLELELEQELELDVEGDSATCAATQPPLELTTPTENPKPDHPPGWAKLSATKKRDLAKHLDDAQHLWQMQDRERDWPGCKKLTPTAERLWKIADRLEAGITPGECLEVLVYLGKQARADEAQRKWFNGDTNWRPQNFDRIAGQASSGSGTRQRAGDFGDAE